jgi:general stress protein 26
MNENELRTTIVAFFKTYDYANLITIDGEGFPRGRMMENLPFGEDLICWFATGAQSGKVHDIRANSRVSVVLYRPADHSSICVQGEAAVVVDDAARAEKWKDAWSAFWPAGPTDPGYALIKILPRTITYLDWPKHQQEVLSL